MTYPTKRSGFTLLELSIALVIIGLVVGGIMVGRDLMQAAGARAAVAQLQEFNTAILEFKTKYDCMPGDCLNMTSYFPAANSCAASGSDTPTGVCNGNGDGKITYQTKEPYIAFQELYLANLIKEYADGNQWSVPFPKLRGQGATAWVGAVYVDSQTTHNDLTGSSTSWSLLGKSVFNISNGPTGDGGGGAQFIVLSANFTHMMDNKVDDGRPLTGSFLVPDYYDGACINAGANAYNNSDQMDLEGSPYNGQIGCIVFMRADF